MFLGIVTSDRNHGKKTATDFEPLWVKRFKALGFA